MGVGVCVCVPIKESDRQRSNSIELTMLSQIVWTSRRAGDTGVDFYVCRRRAAINRNAALGHEIWRVLAIRQVVRCGPAVAEVSGEFHLDSVETSDPLKRPDLAEIANHMAELLGNTFFGRVPGASLERAGSADADRVHTHACSICQPSSANVCRVPSG